MKADNLQAGRPAEVRSAEPEEVRSAKCGVRNEARDRALLAPPTHRGILRRRAGDFAKGAAVALVGLMGLMGRIEAATVIGYLRDISRNPYATNLMVSPDRASIMIDGTNLVASTSTNVIADLTGRASVSLAPGDYKGTIGRKPTDTFKFFVPIEDGTYNLSDLITNASAYANTAPLYALRAEAAPKTNAALVSPTVSGGILFDGGHVTGNMVFDGWAGNRLLVSDSEKFPTESGVTSFEVVHLAGVTASIQPQLDAKAAATNGTFYAATINGVSSNEVTQLSGVTAPIQDQLNAKAGATNGRFYGTVVIAGTINGVSSNEVTQLSGVTSPIQTQLNAKVENSTLTAFTTAWLGSTNTAQGRSSLGVYDGEVPISQYSPAPLVYFDASQCASNVGAAVAYCGGVKTNGVQIGPKYQIDPLTGPTLWFSNNACMISTNVVIATNFLTVMWLDKQNNYDALVEFVFKGDNLINGVCSLYLMKNSGILIPAYSPSFEFSVPDQKGWTVNALVISNNNLYGYVNGVESGQSLSIVNPQPGISGPVEIGYYPALAWNGYISTVAIWTNALPPEDIRGLSRNILRQHNLWPRRQIGFIGDSIMRGIVEPTNYQSIISQKLNTKFTLLSRGISGRQLSTMYATNFASSLRAEDIVILEGGVNDLQYGTNADVVLLLASNVAKTFRDRGAYVVYATPTPCKDPLLTTRLNYETNRQALHTMVTNSWTDWCDGVAWTGADPTYGISNAAWNAAYYKDGVHPGMGGYLGLVTNVTQAIKRILGTAP